MVWANRKWWFVVPIIIFSIALLYIGFSQREKGAADIIIILLGVIGSAASIYSVAKDWFSSSQINEKHLKQNYHKALANKASQLDLSTIADPFAEQGHKVTLDQVYQDQYVRQESKQYKDNRDFMAKSHEESKPIPLLEAVADDDNKRLVILGKVGSGKSSFIDYLSWGIASSWLDQPSVSIPFKKRPVVRIVLRNIAVEMQGSKSKDSYLLIKQAIDNEIEKIAGEVLPHYYEELLEQGVILLDGLDEVTRNDGRLQKLLNAIEDFSQHLSDAARLIITSRPYAYDEHRLAGFKVVELEPMDDQQIKAFIQHWYKIMPPKDIWQNGAVGQASNLTDIILDQRRTYLKKLAETPLTLTLMTSLHYARNILPHSRAELYESSLGLLLDRWQQRLYVYKQDHGFEDYEYKALNVPTAELTSMLTKLANKVHQRQQQEQAAAENNQYTDITRDEIIATFDDNLRRDLDCRADNLLDFMQYRSAILVATSDQHFSFVHRSFQEFLVAKSIANSLDWRNTIKDFVYQDHRWWREVFLLLMGLKSLHSFGDAMSAMMLWIDDLPDDSWQQTEIGKWALIRLSANAAIEVKLLEKLNDDTAYKTLLSRLQEWLTKYLNYKALPILERAEAGRFLGLLGDQRKGVGVKIVNDQCLPDIDWVHIPAKGKAFMMGSDDHYEYEKPAHSQTMPEDYHLSRYPVTNAQFAAFVDGGGYQDQQYWSDKVWQSIQHNKIEYPRYWHNWQWNTANHPVVGVSWFEAMAFVRWLDAVKSEQGRVRLPTEREWEFAARGEQSLIYPWGNDWQAELANTKELSLKQTSAVGLFEQPNPFAVDEMTGNVWEWTQSQWGNKLWAGEAKTQLADPDFAYPYDERDGRENMDEHQAFVLRGGSWYLNYRDCRSSDRNRFNPGFRNYNVGFRLLLSLASDS